MVLARRWRSADTELAPSGRPVTCSPRSQSLAGAGSESDYSGPSLWTNLHGPRVRPLAGCRARLLVIALQRACPSTAKWAALGCTATVGLAPTSFLATVIARAKCACRRASQSCAGPAGIEEPPGAVRLFSAFDRRAPNRQQQVQIVRVRRVRALSGAKDVGGFSRPPCATWAHIMHRERVPRIPATDCTRPPCFGHGIGRLKSSIDIHCGQDGCVQGLDDVRRQE